MAGYQSKLKTFSQRPYYDDFDISKKFSQILFRPGMAIQARELTQLQTILQDQIARMGSHFFDNGAKIIGGETSIKEKIEYIKLPNTITGLPSTSTHEYVGGTITNGTLSANIVHYVAATISDPATIYVEYTSADAHIQSFSSTLVHKIVVDSHGINYTTVPSVTINGDGAGATADAVVVANGVDKINITNNGSGYTSAPTVLIGGVGTGAAATAYMINQNVTFSLLNKKTNVVETFVISNIPQSGIGYGALAFINDGIYFINGRFSIIDKQAIVVSKYTDITASENEISLGFLVNDVIVTPEDDNSLYDNAIGSPNESAPGATRYRMDLTLTVKPTDDTIKNYVQLMVLQSGTPSVPPNQTDYSQLFLDIFARRTYDESGDYVINDFSLDLKEHLNNGTNLGQYTAGINGGDETKLVAVIGAGKAYVRGYEVHKTAPTPPKAFDKSRDTSFINDVYISNPYENYAYIDLDTGGTIPGGGSVTTYPFDLFSRSAPISFKDISHNTLYTVQPMGLEHFAGTIYKLYFTRLQTMVSSAVLTAVKYIDQSSKLAPIATMPSGIPAISVSPSNSSLLLNIPLSYVDKITGSLCQPYKAYYGTVAGGKINLSDTTIQFVSDPDAYTIAVDSVGYVTPLATYPHVGAYEFDVPSACDGLHYTVWASVGKNTYTPRTKTVQSVVGETHLCFSPSDIASVKLNNTDIIKITSISLTDANGTQDYTDHYDLDNGQRDDVYDFGYLKLKAGTPAPTQGTITVSYDYFSHSPSGDYFSVESYSTLHYSDIPRYNGVFLANVIDLRTSITEETTKITPSTDIIIDYSYYLSRIDNIILNSKGVFSIIRGVPSLEPKVPVDADDSITLYTMHIPAYTFKVSDITVDKKNYKRYTMRDIANLDKRVENLEYYTQLSMLESDIQGKEFFDKFKSGYIVDNFESLTTGDVNNRLHTLAIDFNRGELCTETVTSHVNLELKSSSNVTYGDEGIITLPYSETPHVSQTLASTLVRLQPFAQYAWNGKVKLTPNIDRWVSYQYAPDLTLDGGTFPSGTAASTIQNKVFDLAGKVFVGQESSVFKGDIGNAGSTTSSSTVQIGKTTRRNRVTGREWRTTTTTSSTTYVGTKVVDTGAIPWIRSRWVRFSITGLKPNTVVKPYFDGVDVSKYCYQTTSNSPPAWNYWYFWYFWSGYNWGLWDTLLSNKQVLQSNGAGVINGWYLIPNNESLRFKTGVRKFVVKDNTENPSTTASGTYDAAGTSVTLQNVFVTTRVVNTRDFWHDPVAESFVFTNPEGAFVSSIDLFFGPEANDYPNIVSVQVCDMVNGYPGQHIIAKVEQEVNSGSGDATVATRFTFDYPFYLEPNKEYAFIVETNSEDLALWCSELGQKSVRPGDVNTFTGEYINKQPYLGSMFKSQNHTTWTAEQSQDIKFVINRARFNNDVVGQVTFTNKLLESDIDTEANIFKKILVDNPMSVAYGPNLVIRNGGSGYSSASFTFDNTGTSGLGFAANPIIKGGITSYAITNGGSGYTVASAQVVGAGDGAKVSVVLTSGVVTGLVIDNAGDGYNSVGTTIEITGDGTNAAATVGVTGSIEGFTIVSPGNGYTSAPAITVVGTNTTAAVIDMVYENGTKVTVKHKDHGFKVGDTVVLEYPSGTTGTVLGDFTVADISGSHVITDETIDGYTFIVTSTTNTKSVQNGGGQKITATQVIPYSMVRLNTDAVVLNGTSVTWNMKAKGYYSSLNVDNTNYGIVEDKLIDLGTLKVVKYNDDQSIQLTSEITSPNNYISPVLDIHKIGLYVVSNRINEYNDSIILSDSSTSYEVNNSIARYATKNVTLINPSNELQVYLDNNLLSGTKIDVYCKVATKPTSVTLDDVPWKLMTVVSGNSFNDIGEFTETKYQYEAPSDFTNFVVKVVYSSSIQRNDDRYRAITPRSKRLRAIALKN